MHQKNVRNKFSCVLKVVQLVRQYAKIVSGGKKNNKTGGVFFSSFNASRYTENGTGVQVSLVSTLTSKSNLTLTSNMIFTLDGWRSALCIGCILKQESPTWQLVSAHWTYHSIRPCLTRLLIYVSLTGAFVIECISSKLTNKALYQNHRSYDGKHYFKCGFNSETFIFRHVSYYNTEDLHSLEQNHQLSSRQNL